MNVFKQLLGYRESASSEVAKKRLRFVLVQDRLHLSPDRMRQLREELIEVISKYVEIDRDGIDIVLTGDGRQNLLRTDVPVVRAKPE